MLKRIVAALAALFGLVHLAGQPATAQQGPRVKLTTSEGAVLIELYPDRAPQSVKNFLGYVRSGHYDGTLFHRVIAGFMIQGGGFDRSFNQKPTLASIQNEADNGLRNTAGTVAMARTSDPHSATAQFFINVSDNAFLDHRDRSQRGWGYAVFGRVVEGMDVVKRIERVPTRTVGPFGDVPSTPVLIEKAEELK